MPLTAIKRAMRSIAQIKVADVDREIDFHASEIVRLKGIRELIAVAQDQGGAAGDGARPAVTKRQAIVDFLKGRRAPMASAEIAQALSMDRGVVQSTLTQMQGRKLVKRAEEGGWEAV